MDYQEWYPTHHDCLGVGRGGGIVCQLRLECLHPPGRRNLPLSERQTMVQPVQAVYILLGEESALA